MRFVALKSANQQAAAVVFRTRDLLVRQRTQAINALRGHLAEFGVIAAKGPVHTSKLITVIEDPASDLPKWLERSWPYWSRNRSCRAPTGQNVH
jgi:transposase